MKKIVQVKDATNLKFEGKISVFNQIQRNGKNNRIGEDIGVLQIIASNRKMRQVAGKVSDLVISIISGRDLYEYLCIIR